MSSNDVHVRTLQRFPWRDEVHEPGRFLVMPEEAARIFESAGFVERIAAAPVGDGAASVPQASALKPAMLALIALLVKAAMRPKSTEPQQPAKAAGRWARLRSVNAPTTTAESESTK